MGLITELIGQEFASKRQEKQLQIEALSHVMQSSMNPEKKSEYAKEALKKIGLKGQNHEMFHNLLTKTAQADAKGQAKGKDYGSSSAEGGAGQLSQAKPAAKHGKQKGGDNWYDSDKSLFPSAAEEREALKQQQDEADQRTIGLQRQKFEETQRENETLYNANRSFYQDQLKRVTELPLPPEKQQERTMELYRSMEELDRIHHGLPAAEPKQPAAPKATDIHVKQKSTGDWVPALQGTDGKITTLDGKSIDVADVADIDKTGTAAHSKYSEEEGRALAAYREKNHIAPGAKLTATQEQEALKKPDKLDTGELGTRESALRAIHPDWSESRIKVEAANKTLKHLDTTEKANELHVTVGQAAVAANAPVGDIAPQTSPTQKPIERLNKIQRADVTFATNYLSGIMKGGLGMGTALRSRFDKGVSTIRELTGLTATELDARSEARKSDQKAYDRLNLITHGNAALEDALALHADVLTNLRKKLPNGDVTKINEWLMSGAREFNVDGVSEDAVSYGLALAAVRNEYARVISGGGMSIAQVPVEALHSAGDLMREGFTTGNTKAMVDRMKNETTLKTKGYSQELRSLRKRIKQEIVPELYGQQYEDVVGNEEVTPRTPPAGTRPPLSSFEKK